MTTYCLYKKIVNDKNHLRIDRPAILFDCINIFIYSRLIRCIILLRKGDVMQKRQIVVPFLAVGVIIGLAVGLLYYTRPTKDGDIGSSSVSLNQLQ